MLEMILDYHRNKAAAGKDKEQALATPASPLTVSGASPLASPTWGVAGAKIEGKLCSPTPPRALLPGPSKSRTAGRPVSNYGRPTRRPDDELEIEELDGSGKQCAGVYLQSIFLSCQWRELRCFQLVDLSGPSRPRTARTNGVPAAMPRQIGRCITTAEAEVCRIHFSCSPRPHTMHSCCSLCKTDTGPAAIVVW